MIQLSVSRVRAEREREREIRLPRIYRLQARRRRRRRRGSRGGSILLSCVLLPASHSPLLLLLLLCASFSRLLPVNKGVSSRCSDLLLPAAAFSILPLSLSDYARDYFYFYFSDSIYTALRCCWCMPRIFFVDVKAAQRDGRERERGFRTFGARVIFFSGAARLLLYTSFFGPLNYACNFERCAPARYIACLSFPRMWRACVYFFFFASFIRINFSHSQASRAFVFLGRLRI